MLFGVSDKEVILDQVRFVFGFYTTTRSLDFNVTTQCPVPKQVFFALEKLIGPMDGDEFNQMMYEHGVSVCHDIIVTYSDAER